MNLEFDDIKIGLEPSPRNLRDLLHVPGIGPVKAEKYGKTILALLTGDR